MLPLAIARDAKSKRNLFALIIGIDDYANCQKLTGAVADAKAIKEYLESDLQVPKDQIRTIFDHDATREMIVEAFKELKNDQRIKHGDPLAIFYAGHGGELPAPKSWVPWGSKTIQCLLPWDYKDSVVCPIPDRTIGALIEDIAKVKGNNITIILDCCHSASGTRTDNEAYIPRTVDLGKDPMVPELDKEIWGGRAGNIPVGFAHHGLQSHVLLAACGGNELAYEHNGRGQFTAALLETLKKCAIDDLTYIGVIERIQLNKQNPHCEGVNQHRIIFDARVPAGRHVRHPVRVQTGGKYLFGAGAAHGISHGVDFTLYNEQNQALDAATVAVDDTAVIEDFQTTVSTMLHLEDSASFAKLTQVGNLPLCLGPGVDPSRVFEDKFWRMVTSGSKTSQFRLAKEAKEGKVELEMENNLVTLKLLDQQLKRLGMTTIIFKSPLDRLPHVLRAAAHYYWYLDLTKNNDHMDTKDGIVVDFYLLQESDKETNDFGLPLHVPVEPGLCRKDPEVEASNVIDFVVDPGALYGVGVANHTKQDLYLNAFLFNNSSLSIAPCYMQPSYTKIPQAPLKSNGVVTIGYGPGGSTPFTYSLGEGQEIDVGYLKFFFATRPVNLSDIVQPPPFSTVDEPLWIDEYSRKATLKKSPLVQPSVPTDTWFTLVIPVVQRKKAIA